MINLSIIRLLVKKDENSDFLYAIVHWHMFHGDATSWKEVVSFLFGSVELKAGGEDLYYLRKLVATNKIAVSPIQKQKKYFYNFLLDENDISVKNIDTHIEEFFPLESLDKTYEKKSVPLTISKQIHALSTLKSVLASFYVTREKLLELVYTNMLCIVYHEGDILFSYSEVLALLEPRYCNKILTLDDLQTDAFSITILELIREGKIAAYLDKSNLIIHYMDFKKAYPHFKLSEILSAKIEKMKKKKFGKKEEIEKDLMSALFGKRRRSILKEEIEEPSPSKIQKPKPAGVKFKKRKKTKASTKSEKIPQPLSPPVSEISRALEDYSTVSSPPSSMPDYSKTLAGGKSEMTDFEETRSFASFPGIKADEKIKKVRKIRTFDEIEQAKLNELADELEEEVQDFEIPFFEKALSEDAGRPGLLERTIAQSKIVMKSLQFVVGLRIVAIVNLLDNLMDFISSYINNIYRSWKMAKSIKRRMNRNNPAEQIKGIIEDLNIVRPEISRLFYFFSFEKEKIKLDKTFPLDLILDIRGQIDEMKRDLSILTVDQMKSTASKTIGDFFKSFIPNPLEFFTPFKDFVIFTFFMKYTRRDVENMYAEILISYNHIINNLDSCKCLDLLEHEKNMISRIGKIEIKRDIEEHIKECSFRMQRMIQLLTNPRKCLFAKYWTFEDLLREVRLHRNSPFSLELEKRVNLSIDKIIPVSRERKSKITWEDREKIYFKRRIQLQKKLFNNCM